MHKHLEWVRAFREKYSLAQAPLGGTVHLSDMDIILRQAWLMEAGKEVLLAIRRGDMGPILGSLTALAYLALNGVAVQTADLAIQAVEWRHEGSILASVRLISDRINACASGRPEDYSALYCAAARLVGGFLNADFDKAFEAFHQYELERGGESLHESAPSGEVDWHALPDLSGCIYE